MLVSYVIIHLPLLYTLHYITTIYLNSVSKYVLSREYEIAILEVFILKRIYTGKNKYWVSQVTSFWTSNLDHS